MNDNLIIFYFLFSKRRNKSAFFSFLFSVQSDIPQHSLESFSGGSLSLVAVPQMKYSKCPMVCAAGKLLSSSPREGGSEGWREGFKGGVKGWDAPSVFNKFYQVLLLLRATVENQCRSPI